MENRENKEQVCCKMTSSMEMSNVHQTSDAGPLKLTWVLFTLLLYKVFYLFAISMAITAFPESVHAQMFHSSRQVSTPDGYLTFYSHFASWDAEHYLSLAAHGYESGASRCAFYPLFPLAIRYFSAITGISQLVTGMFLANLFSIAGWLIFFAVVRRRLGESIAKLALVLVVTFPGSLFFQFVYTESLFFLLITLLLLGLEQNCFWLTLTAAFLLPLTRAVGLFCIFPLYWRIIIDFPPAWWEKLRSHIPWRKGISVIIKTSGTGAKNISARRIERGYWWLLLAPLCGWAVYLLLMKEWTGNALEGFKAQKQFGIQSIGNIFNIPYFLFTLATPGNFHDIVCSIVDRGSFILVLYSVPITWQLSKDWILWSIFLGIVPAMSGMFVSYTRFAAVVFPLFVAMSFFLDRPGPLFRCLRFLTVTTFATLQVILLWRFVNYRWAG
jgi:hypothetical protein